MGDKPAFLASRRRFLGMAAAAAVSAPMLLSGRARAEAAALFALPPLPYPDDALAPVISTKTIGFHYGKHHKAYVDNLNKLLEGSDLAKKTLAEIVIATHGDAGKVGIFNNAAQAWNHTFYWNSMHPKGGGAPQGALADRIKASFGDFARFRQEFVATAMAQFGSGWCWLVAGADGKLQLVKTGNADTPAAQGTKCLLTCDVWEHAYYLDYQNRRADYVNAWLDKLVNWDFAAQQLAG